jgi:hypothetical protein
MYSPSEEDTPYHLGISKKKKADNVQKHMPTKTTNNKNSPIRPKIRIRPLLGRILWQILFTARMRAAMRRARGRGEMAAAR